jgi:hypothetical protein
MHPLLEPGNPTSFAARLDVPPIPPGNCLLTPDDLRKWIGSAVVNIAANQVLYGFTAGTIASATPESRNYPRFIFDDEERYLGLALWMPSLQQWSIGGQIGQLMVLQRIEASIEDDLAVRPLGGWRLADGSDSGIPDLTANAAYFAGVAPNYTMYTVGYTG